MSAAKHTPGPLEAQVIAIARRNGSLAEVCKLVDYYPDVGRVPEHWRVKFEVGELVNAVAALDTLLYVASALRRSGADSPMHELHLAFNECNAAIAKATGSTS